MNFFEDGSPYFNHPLLTAERTEAEVDALQAILELQPGAKVLDVGCGFGRHCNELARRGFTPTGVDPSAPMIDEAQRRWRQAQADSTGPADSKRQAPTYVVGTVADLVRASQFDGAICLFTTLGQVGNDGSDNTAMVSQLRQRVIPSGIAVFEVPNKEKAVAELVTSDHFETPNGSTTIARSYDRANSRINEEFIVVTNGHKADFQLSYRVFDSEELTTVLTAGGFEKVGLFPSLAAAAEPGSLEVGSDDPTLVAVATSHRST